MFSDISDIEEMQQEIDSLTQDNIRLESALAEQRLKVKKQQKTFKFLQFLYEEISAATDIQQIYEIVVEYLADKVGFDKTIIYKKKDNHFMPIAKYGYSENKDFGNDNPCFYRLIANNQGLFINSKNYYKLSPNYQREIEVKYFIAVPFCVQNEFNHILFVGNHTEDTLNRSTFNISDLEVIQSVANQIAIAINQIQLYAQTQLAAEQAKIQKEKIEATLQQLQITQTQLIQSEKMSSLGQLVAGIAHEINNPVSFIHGNIIHANEYIRDILELIQTYQTEYSQPTESIIKKAEEIELEFIQEDLYKTLNSMRIGSQRIKSIVESLRNFSRLDEAEIKLVDIHEGIESTLTILQHRLVKSPKSQIQVVKDYAVLPKLECYPGELNQAFMHILTNAIDALEENKSSQLKQIKINTLLVDYRWVKITITDTGIGMSKNIIKRIFDPFFTTKPVGMGTGMGMSVCYQIIQQQHGGIIECASTPNTGSTITIKIPIRQKT
ncbi:signal transduction histidine kinase [Rivularia sp. PCC 7116]|uniref:GAF domain-containing sensor histidine kinase n=1 Tax=Rivularia sp. PCC 7116 TaxID=373994 RepID=UPI00029F1746|nr:ATP-binding protein [Rivularia sp. PCC 7116]AFY57277.1 signal transduction histidine kinase [Rivularia sp. PCC 7116]